MVFSCTMRILSSTIHQSVLQHLGVCSWIGKHSKLSILVKVYHWFHQAGVVWWWIVQQKATPVRRGIFVAFGRLDELIHLGDNKVFLIVHFLFACCPNNGLVFKPFRKTGFIHFTCRQIQNRVNSFDFPWPQFLYVTKKVLSDCKVL